MKIEVRFCIAAEERWKAAAFLYLFVSHRLAGCATVQRIVGRIPIPEEKADLTILALTSGAFLYYSLMDLPRSNI